jgi:hypothetical protein
MRRFLRRPDADSKPHDLTPEELVSLLPETAHDTVDTWPLAALPLDEKAKIGHGAERLRATGAGLVRVTGLIRTWHDKGANGLSLTVGKSGNFLSVAVPHVDPKFRHLTGLFMDATVESEGLRDEGFVVVSGQLRQIHGVEQPNLRNGDQALLRGEVVSVEGHEGNNDTYGMRLRLGADQFADISWNPSRSPVLDTEGITQVGGMVLMGVRSKGTQYMWHPNNDESRHFLIEPPIHQE